MDLAQSTAVSAVLDCARLKDEDKQFSTLAAEYALAGHALIRANPGDEKAPYYAMRWGWMKPIHSLTQAIQLLRQIKGVK